MRRLSFVLGALFISGCQCSEITIMQDGGGPRVDAGPGDAGAIEDAGVIDAGPVTWDDFPGTPILDGTTMASVPALFDVDAGTAAGACLLEPENGALFPRDWLRPRFSFAPVNGEDAFRLTLRAPGQNHDLVVFTSTSTWTMPQVMWAGLTQHAVDVDIQVEVVGVVQATGAVSAASTSTFKIAPATASGSIVYWTTSGGTRLKGMKVGQEPVIEVMRPNQANAQCIGCHSSTPDGLYAGMSSSQSAGSGDPSTIQIRSVDGLATEPPFMTLAAKSLLARNNQHAPVFSAGHWRDGDHVVLAALDTGIGYDLVWTDLETTNDSPDGGGTGVLARVGDGKRAGDLSWSHDGNTVIYSSSDAVGSGLIVVPGADVFTVPWNNRDGGTAVPLAGASSMDFIEYYPTYSPGDDLVAYSRVPNTDPNSYARPNAEVIVVPASGGTPVRIAANDPIACSGKTSPGISNSWPKWGPEKTTVGTKTYYWLTFSSTRHNPAMNHPQLYVAPVVVDGTNITSYPALYLWNQPLNESNHTPAWDVFQIVIN